MPYSQLPFRPHKFILEDELKGLEIGGEFRDGKGRCFRLWRLADALVVSSGSAADVVGDGEVMFLLDGGIVTNDLDESTGLDETNGWVAGVMQFDSAGADAATTTIGESEGTTTALRRCVLVQIRGVHNLIQTPAATDDIVKGDMLIGAADGECVDFPGPTTTAPTLNEMKQMHHSVFAVALADDAATGDTVQGLINVRG